MQEKDERSDAAVIKSALTEAATLQSLMVVPEAVHKIVDQLTTAQELLDSMGKGVTETVRLALEQAAHLQVHRRDNYLKRSDKTILPQETLVALRSAPLVQEHLFGMEAVETAIEAKRVFSQQTFFEKGNTGKPPPKKVPKVTTNYTSCV